MKIDLEFPFFGYVQGSETRTNLQPLFLLCIMIDVSSASSVITLFFVKTVFLVCCCSLSFVIVSSLLKNLMMSSVLKIFLVALKLFQVLETGVINNHYCLISIFNF